METRYYTKTIAELEVGEIGWVVVVLNKQQCEVAAEIVNIKYEKLEICLLAGDRTVLTIEPRLFFFKVVRH